ncbi:MAG: hypothetical protein ACYSU7_00905 [Planctomycetota bacterium]|jgi:hypothetical protein
MPMHTLSEWVAHLRAVAGPVATQPPPRWSDEVSPAFAVVATGRPVAAAPSPLPPADAGLWWALADPSVDVNALLDGPDDGALWPLARFSGLEVWTEAELCGLHALWCLARARGREDWARRADRARDWHLTNTQPDNATNRPWALHVFLLVTPPVAEARAYAETLLHNALVTTGRPDLFSAWILLDAANRIEEEQGMAGPEDPPYSPMHRS